MAGRDISYYTGEGNVAGYSKSCTLEYDGASKGNPGQSGAGVILHHGDGGEMYRIRQGLGNATNNEAEYRALNLAMKFAHEKGFEHIHVQGDSQLVTKQVQGQWKARNPNIANLCQEAQDLKAKFKSFEIVHVPREENQGADAEANKATHLNDGEVESERMFDCPTLFTR